MIRIKQYLFSIIICGILCSLMCRLFKKNSTIGMLFQVVAGIFMTITIISPVKKIQLPDLTEYYESIYIDASSITDMASNEVMIYSSSIIRDRTAAYILDKAAAMDIDITVDVTLDDNDPPVPVKVYISGSVSPYDKSVLSEYIQTNLNITKENLVWI